MLVDLHQHPRWGSTVSLGVGGAVAARPRRPGRSGSCPLTDLDAGRLIDASPVRRLIEDCGPTADRARWRTWSCGSRPWPTLLPEVATLRLNPVIVGAEQAWVTGASAKLRPWTPGPDPGLRRL